MTDGILPTAFRRPSDGLPRPSTPSRCVFQPSITPRGVGSTPPLEGGANAVSWNTVLESYPSHEEILK